MCYNHTYRIYPVLGSLDKRRVVGRYARRGKVYILLEDWIPPGRVYLMLYHAIDYYDLGY